jgi:hypothetical protein
MRLKVQGTNTSLSIRSFHRGLMKRKVRLSRFTAQFFALENRREKYTHSVIVAAPNFAEVYLPNTADGIIYEVPGDRRNKLIQESGKKTSKQC